MKRLNLSQLIKTLKQRPPRQDCMFDFGGVYPDPIFHSYRGFYEDLAIEWRTAPITVADFISALEDAIGKTYEGYKGGSYVMRSDSRIWVAEYGRSSGTAIVGVEDCEWMTVLSTRYQE